MVTHNRITIALAQLNSELGNSQTNLERAVGYIEQAAAQGADLIMFPELYLQGYRADEKFALTAEPIPGPTTERLHKLAVKHNLYIVMGMARSEDVYPFCVYNSLCFVGPEGVLGYYDKVHLGTFHPYMEGVYFAPGQRAPVFETRFGRVSLQICYDVCFPELTRVFALKGSLLNLVISAGPSGSERSWATLLQARSMENLFPSVYCNTVGQQKDFSFFGGSKIVSTDGLITAEAKFDAEDFIVASVDTTLALLRRHQQLLFRERRPSIYGLLSEQDVPPFPSADGQAATLFHIVSGLEPERTPA